MKIVEEDHTGRDSRSVSLLFFPVYINKNCCACDQTTFAVYYCCRSMPARQSILISQSREKHQANCGKKTKENSSSIGSKNFSTQPSFCANTASFYVDQIGNKQLVSVVFLSSISIRESIHLWVFSPQSIIELILNGETCSYFYFESLLVTRDHRCLIMADVI